MLLALLLAGCGGGGGDPYTPVVQKCAEVSLPKPGGSEASCPVITNN